MRPPRRSGGVNGRESFINKTFPKGFELYLTLKGGLPHKPAFVFHSSLELRLKKGGGREIITGDH